MRKRPDNPNREPCPIKDDGRDHSKDVRIGALEKDGEQMLKVMRDGGMVAVLSGMEVMYTLHSQQSVSVLHPQVRRGRRQIQKLGYG
jgi:hypothetical protein